MPKKIRLSTEMVQTALETAAIAIGPTISEWLMWKGKPSLFSRTLFLEKMSFVPATILKVSTQKPRLFHA